MDEPTDNAPMRVNDFTLERHPEQADYLRSLAAIRHGGPLAANDEVQHAGKMHRQSLIRKIDLVDLSRIQV